MQVLWSLHESMTACSEEDEGLSFENTALIKPCVLTAGRGRKFGGGREYFWISQHNRSEFFDQTFSSLLTRLSPLYARKPRKDLWRNAIAIRCRIKPVVH